MYKVGNYDVRVDGGKTQIYSGSDIIITSGTTITLNVGSTSIVIQDGKNNYNSSRCRV